MLSSKLAESFGRSRREAIEMLAPGELNLMTMGDKYRASSFRSVVVLVPSASLMLLCETCFEYRQPRVSSTVGKALLVPIDFGTDEMLLPPATSSKFHRRSVLRTQSTTLNGY